MGVLSVPEILCMVPVDVMYGSRMQFMIFYKVFICANVDHHYCEYVNTIGMRCCESHFDR